MHDRNSGHLRLRHILQLLVADGHQITYVAQYVRPGDEEYAEGLRALGINVPFGRLGTFDRNDIRPLLRSIDFDTVIFSFYTTAVEFLSTIENLSPRTRIIVDSVDLHFVRERRAAAASADPTAFASAETTYAAEMAVYGQADEVITVTGIERDILEREGIAAKTTVLPNVHVLGASNFSFGRRNGLLFVGNFWHTPNVEGIVWFCTEVLPRLVTRIPNVMVHVVGQTPPPAVAALAGTNVVVQGWVPSTEPYLQACRVSIAPLLTGAGMKGKVGEALSVGLPVVTTAIGAEGIGLSHGINAMIADTPEAFADAVAVAYLSEDVWSRLSQNGLAHIAENYTPDAALGALRSIVRPAPQANVTFFGMPDWKNIESIARVIGAYAERFAGSTSSCLELAVIGDAATSEAVLDQLLPAIVELGYDPSSLPDIAITPISDQSELANLAPSTVWVPFTGTVDQPGHLRACEPFVLDAHAGIS